MTPRDVEAPGTVAAADRAHGTPSTNAAIVADAGCRDKAAATLGASRAAQALRVIEGEAKAAQYLARLQAEQADPDELALGVHHA